MVKQCCLIKNKIPFWGYTNPAFSDLLVVVTQNALSSSASDLILNSLFTYRGYTVLPNSRKRKSDPIFYVGFFVCVCAVRYDQERRFI